MWMLLLKREVNKDEAIFQVLKKYILESERVLFEGDNYSKEWHKEAKKRGFAILPVYLSQSAFI